MKTVTIAALGTGLSGRLANLVAQGLGLVLEAANQAGTVGFGRVVYPDHKVGGYGLGKDH